MPEIRSSQIIFPFGPGAIIEGNGESFVIMGPGNWTTRQVFLKRLSDRLEVDHFKQPSKDDWQNNGKIQAFRFPVWLFCSNQLKRTDKPSQNTMCGRLTKWNHLGEDDDLFPKCWFNACSGNKLTPMRFVAACKQGHLTDVPWDEWVHAPRHTQTNESRRQCKGSDSLQLYYASNETGFSKMRMVCWGDQHSKTECGARKSFAGITLQNSLIDLEEKSKCNGLQPYMSADHPEKSDCKETLQVFQRNSGSLWYPKYESALDIPTEEIKDDSQEAFVSKIIIDAGIISSLIAIVNLPNAEDRNRLLQPWADKWNKEFGVDFITPTSIINALNALKNKGGNISIPRPPRTTSIRAEEWKTLTDGTVKRRKNRDQNIVFEPRPIGSKQNNVVNNKLRKFFSDIIKIEKIREVQALTGFSRISPDGPEIGLKNKNSLPGVEIKGEGLLICLNEEALGKWEVSKQVKHRAKTLEPNFKRLSISNDYDSPIARLILIHTFSHVLMKEIAFSSGYSLTSIKERLYCSNKNNLTKMAGTLIYTGSSDNEGTLGGLSAQAEEPKLAKLILSSIEKSMHCSFDPVCFETDEVSSPHIVSLASCHGCVSISETSCELFNRVTDRGLLIDTEFGFFKDIFT